MIYKAVTHLFLLTEWSFFLLEHGCSLKPTARVRVGIPMDVFFFLLFNQIFFFFPLRAITTHLISENRYTIWG